MNEPQRHSWTGRLFALAQLVRLPNVFTALADVMMGFLVTHGSLEPSHLFSALMGATVALYWAGMVLNDVFDSEADRIERPARPIPSGRISLLTAQRLAFGLLAAGVVLAAFIGLLAGSYRPPLVAALLAGCVVLYDGWAKQTPIGPVVMGLCRTLNVLLGMSVAAHGLSGAARSWELFEWSIAAGIGVYIAGVTWFARSEAAESPRRDLLGGLIVMIGGLALLSSLPMWTDFPLVSLVRLSNWYLFWVLIALVIVRRCVLALLQPSPQRVQAAVKNSILSLIVIDAGIVLAVCGIYWGCAVLLLLFPAIFLGRWLYST